MRFLLFPALAISFFSCPLNGQDQSTRMNQQPMPPSNDEKQEGDLADRLENRYEYNLYDRNRNNNDSEGSKQQYYYYQFRDNDDNPPQLNRARRQQNNYNSQ